MTVTLDTPLDMHLHFREGEIARTVVPLSAHHFSGGIVMPNLVPPVDNEERLHRYRHEIDTLVEGTGFTPLYTIFLRPYSESELTTLRPFITAAKLYPAGVTTNSESGVADLSTLFPTLALLEEMKIPLLVHGETHGFVMDREAEFLPFYAKLATTFPRLRIVMEHITTAGAVDLVDRFENLSATITAHHLLTSLDDVLGGLLDPHLFCKPIPKRPIDREALLQMATSGHPKVCFGSDSAPHPRDKKECCGCAAGVFTAPIALPLLAMVFSERSRISSLQSFVSDNARKIYPVTVKRKMVSLVEDTTAIPETYGTVVPMWAGRKLPWRVTEVTALPEDAPHP
jgi:dihydroorotase